MVAGPWLLKNRLVNSASASSRDRRVGLAARSCEQRVGRLLATERAAADHPFQLRVRGQQRETHAFRRHAGTREAGAQFSAREALPVAEGSFDHAGGAVAQREIQFEHSVPVGQTTMNSRGRQLEHPVQVRGGDEVPGWPHDMRAEDAPVVERALDAGVGRAIRHPQRERPFRGRIVLCLHGTEPRDQVCGVARALPRQALILESLEGDSRSCRGGSLHPKVIPKTAIKAGEAVILAPLSPFSTSTSFGGSYVWSNPVSQFLDVDGHRSACRGSRRAGRRTRRDRHD